LRGGSEPEGDEPDWDDFPKTNRQEILPEDDRSCAGGTRR
jgi:hypothetical protein